MTPSLSRRTILLLAFCLPATAQVRHGTAVVAIRHGNNLVIAADSLETAPHQASTLACKIFTSGHTVFSLSGIAGIGPYVFADIFLQDPTFTHVYDEATLQIAAQRWASTALDALNTHFRTDPNEYRLTRKADRSTVAIFAEITTAGKLILIQERLHDDPTRAKSFPYLIADSSIISVDETMILGNGSLDTYAEMRAATSLRALEAKALFLALDRPPTLPLALQTAQSFIATTESWHPEESGGDIAELAISPAGLVWTNQPPVCR